jgi:hypothetical protein
MAVSSGDQNQSAGKSTAKNSVDGAASKTAGTASVLDVGYSKAGATNGAGASNAAQHGQGNGGQNNGAQSTGSQSSGLQNDAAHKDAAQSGDSQSGSANIGQQSSSSQSSAQAMPHAQVDASAARLADGAVGQPQTVPIHAPATASAGTTTSAATPRPGLPGSDTASLAADSDEPAAASGINAAKLLQTMGGTEMRVGMNSSEFGDISIRAAVSQQQMTAQISLDHTDLGQAIAAHIANAQTKLGNEYGLHASIEVSQQGASFSGGSPSGQAGSGGTGNSAQREQRDFIGSGGTEIVPAVTEMDYGVGYAATASVADGRLDISA